MTRESDERADSLLMGAGPADRRRLRALRGRLAGSGRERKPLNRAARSPPRSQTALKPLDTLPALSGIRRSA